MLTSRHSIERRGEGGVLWLVALLLVVVSMLGKLNPVSMPEVVLTDHAVQRHGSDADHAVEVLAATGPEERFDWRCNDQKHLRAAQDADGRWAVLLTINLGGAERRITSLMMRSRSDVFKWADKNGCRPTGYAY